MVRIVGDASALNKTYAQAERSTKRFGREMETMGRGAISASVGFRGLGRSIAFASGGFLAFAGVGEALRTSIDAGREAAVTQRQLATQLKTSGVAWGAVKDQIEQADLSLSKISGFNTDQLEQSLTTLVRSTGDVNTALRLNEVAADIARGRHIKLAQAAIALGKAYNGSNTALQRLGIQIPKGVSGLDAINVAAARFAGQAQAGATAADRFGAELHNSEVIIGTALLPTLNKLLVAGTEWLDQMNRTGRLQRDVAAAVKFGTDTLNALKAILTPVVALFRTFSGVLGGTKNALIVLAGAYGAVKLLGPALAAVGTSAEGSVVGVTALRVALAGPGGLVAAAGVALIAMQQLAQQAAENAQIAEAAPLIKGSGLETTLVPRLAKQIEALKKAGQTSAQIIATLRQQLGGSLKGDDLIAEAFQFSTGVDPKLAARIKQNVAAKAKAITKVAGDALGGAGSALGGGGTTITAGQRNTWFDNMINRALGQVQDISSLQGQIGRLNQIAGLLQQRIAITKDITHKHNLEDKMAEVQRMARSTSAQQIANAKQAADDVAQRAALARQAQIDAQQLAIARAQATPGFEDDLATEQRLVEILKKQLAADKNNVDLQRQLFDAEQAVKDTLKQRSDAAKQAKIDAAGLAVQRAEMTKTLTDDLAAAINQVAVLKKTGATASEILSAQTNVKDKRDQIGQQRKDDVQKARQAKVDAADLAVLRTQLTKTLSDDLAAAIYRLGVLRKTGAAESDIVSAMLDVKDKRQQQAQAAKDAAKAAKETAAAARQAQQFARLGFGPTGGDTLPSAKALQKRLGRLEDAVQGTILDTPRMQARLNHLRQVLSGSLGKVGGDVRVKIKEIMDGITQALQKKTKPPKKGTIADVIMTIFDPSSVPKDFILGPGIQLRRPTPGERAAARFETGPDLRRRLPGTVGGAAGAAAGRGIARGMRLPRGVTGAADFMRLPRDVTGVTDFRRRPTTVIVNQYFQKPTVDLHREARYAKIATRSVFDQ